MKYKVNKKGIIISKIFSVIFWNQFRYPQPIRGRYDIEDVYDFRLLKFKDVLDNPEDYGLTDDERSDLERLDKHVLKKIL